MQRAHDNPTDAKRAVVTGAASGLGRALSVVLANAGWTLALVDLDEAENLETLRQVEAAGGRGQIETLDVADAHQWDQLCRRLQTHWTALDLLVNNAGIVCVGELGRMPLADWHRLLGVNLMGPINGCHAMVDWLKQNPAGAHIVNVASIAAVVAAPSMAAYNASKAALIAFSETLYAELRPCGVHVTTVCPGFFASRLLECGQFQDRRQRAAAEAYMKRARISAEDVAESIYRAMLGRRPYVVVPAKARWYWRLKRMLPGTMLRLMARGYERQLQQARDANGEDAAPRRAAAEERRAC